MRWLDVDLSDRTVLVEPITPEDGGGFHAYVAEFGRAGLVGTGETEQEAMDSLMGNWPGFQRLMGELGAPVPPAEPQVPQEGFQAPLPRRTGIVHTPFQAEGHAAPPATITRFQVLNPPCPTCCSIMVNALEEATPGYRCFNCGTFSTVGQVLWLDWVLRGKPRGDRAFPAGHPEHRQRRQRYADERQLEWVMDTHEEALASLAQEE